MQRGTAVSRDDVARAGWPEREDGDVGNQEIEQCIRRIRRRIERDPSAPELIVTRRSFGYIMP
jgi:DNA-binding response OmpR family regulator